MDVLKSKIMQQANLNGLIGLLEVGYTEQNILREELSNLLEKYIARSREMTKDPICTADILNDTLSKCEALREILSKIEKG